jgi:hypothetical protein
MRMPDESRDPVEIVIRPDGSIDVDANLSESYLSEYADYMRSIGRSDLLEGGPPPGPAQPT